jgi:hypothetical protein
MCGVKFLYEASKVRGRVYMCCEVPVPSQQSEGSCIYVLWSSCTKPAKWGGHVYVCCGYRFSIFRQTYKQMYTKICDGPVINVLIWASVLNLKLSVLYYGKKVETVMVSDSTNINKRTISSLITEHKKTMVTIIH